MLPSSTPAGTSTVYVRGSVRRPSPRQSGHGLVISRPNPPHYLEVKLEGEGMNRFAIGAMVTLRAGKDTLYQELSPTRGFQSSSDYVLAFGLGARDTVTSVKVEWPDGRVSEVGSMIGDQRVTVKQSQSVKGKPEPALSGAPAALS